MKTETYPSNLCRLLLVTEVTFSQLVSHNVYILIELLIFMNSLFSFQLFHVLIVAKLLIVNVRLLFISVHV